MYVSMCVCTYVYTCAARATSGLFVMLSRHLGGLWGTLLGMAIYFVALYCAFMLVTVRQKDFKKKYCVFV
jgi:hypothetical protein